MSHFTVAVIGNDVEEALAPFQENNMGDCPEEYMKFNDTTEEYEKEWKSGKCDEFYCSSSSSWGQEISKENLSLIKKGKVGDKFTLDIKKGDALSHYFKKGAYYSCYAPNDKHEAPKKHIWVKVNKIISTTHPDKDICFEGKIEVELVKAPKQITFKKKYKTFENFLKDWHGVTGKDAKTGRYGYWENPNAKWDWYQVGGRWSGFFKLKSGKRGQLGEKSWTNEGKKIDEDRADQAKRGDIDFEKMRSDNFEHASKRYDEFEALMKSDPKKAQNEAYFTYGVENKGTRDKFIPETRAEYLKRKTNPSTFAVVKDGKWYQRGDMGWWGMTSNEKAPEKWDEEFMKLLESVDADTLITVVDCHI